MRLKIQLSRPTLLAFKSFKSIAYGDENLNATNGYILGVALKELLPIISSTNDIENLDLVDRIEWKELLKKSILNVTDSDDTETVRTRTTLTIEHSVYNALNVLQNQFLTIFDAKRIYRAFVVKMVLFAAIDKRINNLNK